MVREKQDKYWDALLLAQRQFAARDMDKIVELSGGLKVGDSELIIPYCGNLFKVNYPEGSIRPVKEKSQEFIPDEELQLTDQILILQYLAEVSGVPLKDKWISFLELPGGPHHHAPFIAEAINPLVKRFGCKPADFDWACTSLKGREIALGHLGYELDVFPKLKLAFVLYLGDDEFPPKGNILFDASASLHLNTAGLYVLGINAVEKLIDLADEREEQNGTI